MAKLYNELDVKIEEEKLQEEFFAETKLSESLRKVHVEQLTNVQQSKLEMEKLTKELNANSAETCEIRQMYEELRSSLHKRDLFLWEISSANEKLRAEYSEKFLKLEGENRYLALALDKSSARIQVLENKTSASSQEIVGLKSLLPIEAEKIMVVHNNVSKDMKEGEEYILKLEEEIQIVQDQLKWKNEQFSCLEEEHKNLKSRLLESKVEWQEEKSLLINEISSLQANLDAQTQVCENPEIHLRMANETLAHEESRRVLEVELPECRSQFDNVSQECNVEKSEIEELAMRRDEVIAELWTQMRRKEMLADEMKHRTVQLEQENSDLLGSLKAIQDFQLTKNATTSSLKNLQNKLQGLEQLHGNCVVQLREKEADWNSQIEKLTEDMKYYVSELDGKDKIIREIQKELEDCQWLLEVKNEETFTLIMMIKSEFHAAYSKLYDAKKKSDIHILQSEEKNVLLNQQLQLKYTELHNVYAELKQRCDEIAVLTKQVESSESLNQNFNLKEEEIRKHKVMLKESNERQHLLEQQFLEECKERENIQNALEMVNFELVNRTSELEESRLEMQKLKSEVESLRSNLEVIQEAHNQEKASLLDKMNDIDAEIAKAQKHISHLESAILDQSRTSAIINQEKDNYLQLAEDRNCTIENLKNENAHLQKKLAEKEAGNIASLVALNALEQENKKCSAYVVEKDKKIEELEKKLESLDHNLKGAMISSAEREVRLDEALKMIEDKNHIITNFEKEVNGLCKEGDIQEKSLIQSNQRVLLLEDSLQKYKSEMQELECQLEKEKSRLEEHALCKQASIDKEYLTAQLEGIFGQIEVFCKEDVELRELLRKILHLSEGDGELERTELPGDGNDLTLLPARKSIQVTFDGRSPLIELNCL